MDETDESIETGTDLYRMEIVGSAVNVVHIETNAIDSTFYGRGRLLAATAHLARLKAGEISDPFALSEVPPFRETRPAEVRWAVTQDERARWPGRVPHQHFAHTQALREDADRRTAKLLAEALDVQKQALAKVAEFQELADRAARCVRIFESRLVTPAFRMELDHIRDRARALNKPGPY